MADEAISELTEQTSVAADDLFVFVDDSASSDKTKNVKAENLGDSLFSLQETPYGTLYIVAGATAINLTALTWTLISVWSNGNDQDIVAASNKLTIGTAGLYAVSLSISATGQSAAEYTISIYVNGSRKTEITMSGVELFEGANVASILSLSAADEITAYVYSDTAGNWTLENGNLSAWRII